MKRQVKSSTQIGSNKPKAELEVRSSPESQRPSETSMTLGEEFKARAAKAGALWARARGAMVRGAEEHRTDADVEQPAK
jgi:hypothetical protein